MNWHTVTFKIKSITILTGRGSDEIGLETDLPNEVSPCQGNACLTVHVSRGTGKDYCEQNFPGIPVKVIEW